MTHTDLETAVRPIFEEVKSTMPSRLLTLYTDEVVGLITDTARRLNLVQNLRKEPLDLVSEVRADIENWRRLVFKRFAYERYERWMENHNSEPRSFHDFAIMHKRPLYNSWRLIEKFKLYPDNLFYGSVRRLDETGHYTITKVTTACTIQCKDENGKVTNGLSPIVFKDCQLISESPESLLIVVPPDECFASSGCEDC